MSSDGGSWAPFGPSSDDEPEHDPPPVQEPPASEPPPVSEPPPASEPPPEQEPPPEPEPPSVTFAPPTAPPLTPLPTLPEAGASSNLGWPDPVPRAEPPDAPQAQWPPTGYQTPKTVPSSATVAIVLGVASVFCLFTGPFAIHYGLQARRQIDSDPALGGRGLANWGLGIGVFATASLVLVLILIAVGAVTLEE